jgi:hypothetical protein
MEENRVLRNRLAIAVLLPGCRVTQHRPFQFLDITGSYLGSHAEINQPHFTATRLIHGVIRLCLIEGKISSAARSNESSEVVACRKRATAL